MLNINKIKGVAVVAGLFLATAAWGAGSRNTGGSHGSFGGGSHGSFGGGANRGSFGGASHGSFGSSHPMNAQGSFHNNSRPSFGTSGLNNSVRRNDIYDYTHQRSSVNTGSSGQANRGFNSNRNFPDRTEHGSHVQTNPGFNSNRSFPDHTEHGSHASNQTVHSSFQQNQGANHLQGSNSLNNQRGASRPGSQGSMFHTAPNQAFRTTPNGTRFSHVGNRVEMWRPDGTRTVRSGNGIIHERVFTNNNRTFVQRTFIRNNVVSVRNYTVTYWGHRPFFCYTPIYVYPAPFYYWYWRPWAPVYYSWWWYDDPWYGYYGYYWRPYPVYYGPGFWLTDFVIADILATSYAEDRAEDAARARDASYAAIDDHIKAEVRREVDAELKAREQQTSVPLDKAVSKGYVHVVTKEMNVAVASSDESCTLSSGDIVKVAKAPSKDDAVVPMTVVTSKRGGCRPNTQILMSLDDVQDMRNHFSESIDRGLEKLHQNQGKGGLPAAPAEAQTPPQETVTPEEKAAAVKEAESAAQELQSEYPTNESLPTTAP